MLLASPERLPPAEVVVFGIAGICGLFFWLRIIARGLGPFAAWGPVFRPGVGLPFVGWLWFGNPLGDGRERIIAVVNILGLVFCLVSFFWFMAHASNTPVTPTG